MRKTKCKKFIIKNFDKFEYDNKNNYFIMSIKNSYYTKITIKFINMNNEFFYNICYFGNRKSWLWDFKQDFYFSDNNLRENKDHKLDSQIIDFIKSKKK